MYECMYVCMYVRLLRFPLSGLEKRSDLLEQDRDQDQDLNCQDQHQSQDLNSQDQHQGQDMNSQDQDIKNGPRGGLETRPRDLVSKRHITGVFLHLVFRFLIIVHISGPLTYC